MYLSFNSGVTNEQMVSDKCDFWNCRCPSSVSRCHIVLFALRRAIGLFSLPRGPAHSTERSKFVSYNNKLLCSCDVNGLWLLWIGRRDSVWLGPETNNSHLSLLRLRVHTKHNGKRPEQILCWKSFLYFAHPFFFHWLVRRPAYPRNSARGHDRMWTFGPSLNLFTSVSSVSKSFFTVSFAYVPFTAWCTTWLLFTPPGHSLVRSDHKNIWRWWPTPAFGGNT